GLGWLLAHGLSDQPTGDVFGRDFHAIRKEEKGLSGGPRRQPERGRRLRWIPARVRYTGGCEDFVAILPWFEIQEFCEFKYHRATLTCRVYPQYQLPLAFYKHPSFPIVPQPILEPALRSLDNGGARHGFLVQWTAHFDRTVLGMDGKQFLILSCLQEFAS